MAADHSERLQSGVFRYTDLAIELQELILEEAIVAAQMGNEKLSNLAAVSRQWQGRVEKITFASLGDFPASCPSTYYSTSSFTATDLREFECVVVGARRANLHNITIDFNLDADLMEDLQAITILLRMERNTRSRAMSTRRHQRFTDYMRELFRILHTWDAVRTGQSHLNVKIRVCGQRFVCGLIPDDGLLRGDTVIFRREDFTELPHVSGIRSFELINENFERNDFVYFLSPGSLNVILSRLSQIDSATIDVNVPASTRTLQFELIGGTDSGAKRTVLGSPALLREALIDLPRAIPSTLKKLVLKNSIDMEHILAWGGNTPAHGDCEKEFQSLCVLSHRLEQLTLDYAVRVDTFLAQAVQSQSISPWPHMRHFEINGCEDGNAPSSTRCLALTISLMACTPMLETLDVKLVEPEAELQGRVPLLRIKAEYVKTTNRDDHVLLIVTHSTSLTVHVDEEWERIIQKSRGVPLRVLIVKEEDEEIEEIEETEEDEEIDYVYEEWLFRKLIRTSRAEDYSEESIWRVLGL